MSLSRTLPILLTGALLAPAAADARIPIRVGIGDQQPAMFGQSNFQRAKFKRARYVLPYNAMSDDTQRAKARAFVLAARAEHVSVVLHLSTDDQRVKKGHLPTVSEYRRQIRRIVAYFRPLGVREFGAWNEANHASQPTWNHATRAADFFREAYRAVKGSCRSCGVIALDVLDQAHVDAYMRSFYRHLSSTYRRRATIVGIHNYGDVNRRRSHPYTATMIRQAHAYNRKTRFWLTETGGIVKFGRSFPCNQIRAAHRLSTMFHLANRYRRSGVERMYLYNWTGATCSDRFDAGLVNPDGSARSGYTYLRKKLPGYLR